MSYEVDEVDVPEEGSDDSDADPSYRVRIKKTFGYECDLRSEVYGLREGERNVTERGLRRRRSVLEREKGEGMISAIGGDDEEGSNIAEFCLKRRRNGLKRGSKMRGEAVKSAEELVIDKGVEEGERVNEEEFDDEGLDRLKEAFPSGSTAASYDKACAEMVDSDDDFDCDEEVGNGSNRGVDLVSDEEVVMRDGVKISEKDDVKECLGQLADMFETVKTKLHALGLEDKGNRPRCGISELFTFFSFAFRGLCI